jgi:uncharacterized protein YlxW (UPF0749 family)
MLRARGTRAEAVVAVLTLLLGFALAVSVRTNTGPTGLAAARQEDLVRILDDLEARAERLRREVATLQQTRDRLGNGGGAATAALVEARARAAALGILAGTVAATGPGIVLTISDPRHQVTADVLVDAIEELRDAGAEAIDLGGVRIVASSYVLDQGTSLTVDGRTVSAPYVLTVIGDPETLAAALQIPGGVTDTVAAQPGARAAVLRRPRVVITSLRESTPAQ